MKKGGSERENRENYKRVTMGLRREKGEEHL